MLFVVASKIDRPELEAVSIREASDFAKKIRAHFHQTSAKEGIGITELFNDIAKKLYLQEITI